MKRPIAALLAAAAVPIAAAAAVLFASQPAQAASLAQVTNFGSNPTNLGMYVYVPAKVAPKPALLVAIHYCTGSASAMFSGNGRDYVTAADKYGYVIVFPEATRSGHCFDVWSPNGLKRDGGSDSTGIMSMVNYAKKQYNVDPGRVYATGFSSGAMMTNVMLAEYPDVFAAGSAFSGVPATCFATGTMTNTWNGDCSGGNVSKSAQQWGDTARAMYPGYTGKYPRMQVWHGTTDTTLSYKNFGEEIKQWTNLNGLSETPALTDKPQSNWTRTRYGDKGTQATVEGVSIAGVGHELPQNGMIAYAIEFLGLNTAPSPSSQHPSSQQPSSQPASSGPASSGPASSNPPASSPAASSQAPSSNPPASSNPPVTASCKVSYVTSAWNTGMTANITVVNTSNTPINGWTLGFTLPAGQTITSSWSATYSPTSGAITAKNVGYNGTIAPGASIGIGFQANHNGDSGKPTAFTLNGATCTVA